MNRALVPLLLLTACGDSKSESFLRDGIAYWWSPIEDCEPTTFYEDLDGDGFGVTSTGIEGETCRPPELHSQQSGDCDDRASHVYPTATEVCDGRDNNCDGQTDDEDSGLRGGLSWYADADGDGYGQEDARIADNLCEGPPDSSAIAGDCDDDDPSAHPGRSEDLEDGVDNNCNGLIDLDGDLSGLWLVAQGEGPEPGARDCADQWLIDGYWSTEMCPDCMLSFWVNSVVNAGSDDGSCPIINEDEFGLHVFQTDEAELLLALSTLVPGYSYYGYYGTYSTPAYYSVTYVDDAIVEWDGSQLTFEAGFFDLPVETADGTEYVTDGWQLAATVQ